MGRATLRSKQSLRTSSPLSFLLSSINVLNSVTEEIEIKHFQMEAFAWGSPPLPPPFLQHKLLGKYFLLVMVLTSESTKQGKGQAR